MEAYIDTNVILDAMLDRDEWAKPAKQILYAAAKRNDIKYIVTRNKKDFTDSSVTILSPDEFITLISPET